jgi:hypothetical protein
MFQFVIPGQAEFGEQPNTFDAFSDRTVKPVSIILRQLG